MRPRGWRVWTSEDVYDSVNHKASDVPDDVQIVMYYLEPPNRHVVMGEDFYEVDGVTLAGTYMEKEAFWDIADRAMADMEWPK